MHAFRTASRRVQTLLEEGIFAGHRHEKKLLKMLEQVRKRAGKVRDLDVQLTALRSLKVPQQPRRKTQLMQGLIELRVKHEKKLRKALDKKTIREIGKRLKRASKEARPEAAHDALKIARAMLAKVARPAGPITEDVLRQYRTVVKRARYAVEFAPKSAEATHLVSELKRLQDAVGNWTDWLTLTRTAAKRLGEVNQSSLVAVLSNVTAGKFRHAVAVLSASSTFTPQKPLPMPQDLSRRLGAKGPALLGQVETAA